MTQQIFMRLHIVYELRLQRKLSTIARQTQWCAQNTQRNNIRFLFGTATYTCTFLISDPIAIIHWSSMTKCSLSEMYKILCGVLNYVHIILHSDWVSSFSPSCRVKLNAYAVGWVGIDGVKQLQVRPAVERPTAWSRWYHSTEESHLSKYPNFVH